MSRLYEGLWWAKLTLEDGTIKHSEVAPYEDIERFIQDASWSTSMASESLGRSQNDIPTREHCEQNQCLKGFILEIGRVLGTE